MVNKDLNWMSIFVALTKELELLALTGGKKIDNSRPFQINAQHPWSYPFKDANSVLRWSQAPMQANSWQNTCTSFFYISVLSCLLTHSCARQLQNKAEHNHFYVGNILCSPLLIEFRVVEYTSSDSGTIDRWVRVHGPDEDLNLRHDTICLLFVLTYDSHASYSLT